MTSEIEKRIKALSKYNLVVSRFNLSIDNDEHEPPLIEFDRTSYPGFEAHLFTIADASRWVPELSSTENLLLVGSGKRINSYYSWTRLLDVTDQIMSQLELYRQELNHGIVPSTNWLFNENQWYRKNWDHPQQKTSPIDEFLPYVDESIRVHIKELNELGFPTTQSCSGVARDHTNREPYLPYVMFDERAYPRSTAHLFTLADIAGWIPSYGPHNFDIEFRLLDSTDADLLWDRLLVCAHRLAKLLQDYRTSIAPLVRSVPQQFQIL